MPFNCTKTGHKLILVSYPNKLSFFKLQLKFEAVLCDCEGV